MNQQGPAQNLTEWWSPPSARTIQLLRQGSQMALDCRGEWAEEMGHAGLNSLGMKAYANDPVLAENTGQLNLLNLMHWVSANIQAPGAPVSVPTHEETRTVARDLVRHGLDATVFDSYRAAATVAWRRWTQICFDLTSNPSELRALLDFSIQSISAYVDDLVVAMAAEIARARDDLNQDAKARRDAVVALLLEGGHIDRQLAESVLGYALTGPHLAAIVWSTCADDGSDVDAAVEMLKAGPHCRRTLTVIASTGSRWLWLPVSVVCIDDLTAELSRHPDVRIAFGRPATNLDGFRRSHFDAATTQRFLISACTTQQAAQFEDVRLAALLTSDPERTDEFVRETLGDLANADSDTIKTLATWIALKCNTAAAAATLYAHRNTVIRRLAMAEELLPVPLAHNLVDVAAALEVLRWTTSCFSPAISRPNCVS